MPAHVSHMRTLRAGAEGQGFPTQHVQNSYQQFCRESSDFTGSALPLRIPSTSRRPGGRVPAGIHRFFRYTALMQEHANWPFVRQASEKACKRARLCTDQRRGKSQVASRMPCHAAEQVDDQPHRRTFSYKYAIASEELA